MITQICKEIINLDNASINEEKYVLICSFNYDEHDFNDFNINSLIDNLKIYFKKVIIDYNIVKTENDYCFILQINNRYVLVHYSYIDYMYNIIYYKKKNIRTQILWYLVNEYYYDDTEEENEDDNSSLNINNNEENIIT